MRTQTSRRAPDEVEDPDRGLLTLGALMLIRPHAGLAFEELAQACGFGHELVRWRFGPSEDIDGVVFAVDPADHRPRYAWLQDLEGVPDEWLDLREGDAP